MARSKVTQGRVEYLVSLGFEISDSLSTDKIRKMYKDVKALENAFASIGKELPKMLGTQTFEEYFQNYFQFTYLDQTYFYIRKNEDRKNMILKYQKNLKNQY